MVNRHCSHKLHPGVCVSAVRSEIGYTADHLRSLTGMVDRLLRCHFFPLYESKFKSRNSVFFFVFKILP